MPLLEPFLDWACTGAGLDGGESGDLHLVVGLPHGALVALIDGLGHGPEAAVAAREAAAILQAHAALSIAQLVELCHEGLRKTRGVVMSLVTLDAQLSTIDWYGVGNVEGALFRANRSSERVRESIATRGGVVGYRLPPTKVSSVPIAPRDLLVLATDGIRSDFLGAVDPDLQPQHIADAVFASCAKNSDDALVFVARYLGGAA
jgi:phosphoserine phosphatase RsbX